MTKLQITFVYEDGDKLTANPIDLGVELTEKAAKKILFDAGYKVAHNIPMDDNQKKLVSDALVFAHRNSGGAA